MPTVNIQEAKTHLSRLLERVRQGETITIAKAGEPIAELRPISKPDIVFGGLKDLIKVDLDAYEEHDKDIAAMWDPDLGVTQ